MKAIGVTMGFEIYANNALLSSASVVTQSAKGTSSSTTKTLDITLEAG